MFLSLNSKNRRSASLENYSDEELVMEYVSSGNKEHVAQLFERYTHLVYGICLNYLQDHDQCKDAVMEIFESLFQKLAMHKVANFRNWLYSVTKNHCLMMIRKSGTMNRAKIRLADEGDTSEFPEFGEGDEELLYSKTVILSALEQLNSEQGVCIRLMYIDEKSYRDISDITGFSMNEVKSHIQNGKRNLKNYLLKQNGNPNA